ncbi:hypothetical protein [Rhodococcus koreensis]|uniref:hypothetical protein n=1 Tax=Rhodococcus koreensis TaxID=99653 RepID=UPI00197FE6D7|nr:hypothetical protein [Rhodococcus koreensis]QSE77690.1 hypothetical protein JWS14_00020 [Rhodococcus koreensis]
MDLSFGSMRALRWLADTPQAATLPENVVPRDEARSVYDELRSQGIVADTLTMNGTPEGDFDFIVTAQGSVEARLVRRIYRAELAQRRVLEWLRSSTSLNGLATSAAAADFTGPLTHEEISEAAHELHDRQLLDGRTQANGEFVYLEIKSAGRAALRSPRPISNLDGQRASITTISANNYGSTTIGNQVVGGQSHAITANMASGLSLSEALEAIEQLRARVASAPVDKDDLDDVLEDIDGVLAKGAKRGLAWLRDALQPVATQIASVCGQELADRVREIGSSIV